MEYSATAKYIRMSPRKVRLVARAVSGMSATRAVAVLLQTSKFAAEPIIKAVKSALAAAKAKGATESALTIQAIDVQEGPVMKRWHAVSRGMAHGYKKRMSHIYVILTDSKKEGER